MNEIISSAIWSPVRLLEKNEFASGGINGNMNEHAIALVNRTHFLKELMDELKNEVARLTELVENCNCSGEPEPGYPLSAISVGISPNLQYIDDWTEGKIRWAIEVNDTLYPTEIGKGGEYSYLEDYLQENKEMLGITGEYKEAESAVYIHNITNTRKFVRLIPNVPYTSNMSNMTLIGNPTAVIDSEGVISFWLEANNEVQIPDETINCVGALPYINLQFNMSWNGMNSTGLPKDFRLFRVDTDELIFEYIGTHEDVEGGLADIIVENLVRTFGDSHPYLYAVDASATEIQLVSNAQETIPYRIEIYIGNEGHIRQGDSSNSTFNAVENNLDDYVASVATFCLAPQD